MSTAIATASAPAKAKPTIKQLLEGDDFKLAIAKALPSHLKPDRFLRVAQTAMTTTPKLALCTQASFFGSLLKLSQYGLEPDGRRAHLIPYKNGKLSQAAGHDVYDCQLIVDYKGIAELVMRSGLVSYLHADVIRRGDLFDYSMGELKDHKPWFLRNDADKPEKAGDVYAAYALARMKDGTVKVEVVPLDQLEAIRQRSKSGQDGPWITDRAEMQKKTAFRRLSKWLPLSSEIRDATENDDDVIDVPVVTTQSITAGGLGAALLEDSDEGAEVVAQIEAPAVDREKLIVEMQDAVLGSKGKLTETKLLEFAKRSQLVPEGIDDVWTLPTAALVQINSALADLSKGGAK